MNNPVQVKWCNQNIPNCKLPIAIATRKDDSKKTPKEPSTTEGRKRRKRDVPDDCPVCSDLIVDKIDAGFNAVGGLGLFFSLTEVREISEHFLCNTHEFYRRKNIFIL